MKFVSITLFILALFACGGNNSTSSEVNKSTDSVLFIGNSYTYRNGGIDRHLKFLLIGTDRQYEKVIRCTAKGQYHLFSHWKDPETKLLIKSKKWDKIVLQEYGSGAWKETEEFQKSVRGLAKDIRAVNKDAEIFLFSTWNYRSALGMEDSLYKYYSAISKEVEANVIPAGFLWRELRPKMDLYETDGAHPNPTGTFVCACLFYERLFNLDVRKTKNLDPELSVSEQKEIKELVHQFNLQS